MKKVKIVYNPFLITTTITVDGKEPRQNSSLDFHKQRLQEWAEKLPGILKEEYRDLNVEVEFTGTLDDFNDLKEILNANKHGVKFSDFLHHRTPDVKEVEDEVMKIYKEITDGPVNDLKDKHIRKAFEKAMAAEFAINVVATMSAGKSTLINSILGKELMPVANMATTATIVSIKATPQKTFDAIAFDANGKKLHEERDITLEKMREWNNDDRISSIDLYGPIPCVDNMGMRLIIVDTPGPNNSCDPNHRKLTYDMLEASDKSLVLFVMNAGALGIDDDAKLLEHVCQSMKKGGKQSRERFIFAVNKMDLFKPKNGETVEGGLKSVKENLDKVDIREPNIFPASSVNAVEIRTEEQYPEELDKFKNKCSRGEEFHFEKYYDYNHLPIPSRSRLQKMMKEGDEKMQTLIHTGIPSIEEAIRLYMSKYARTLKVKDLVDSFNNRLTELNSEAELLDSIKGDKEKKKKLEEDITKIQNEIESGKSAKEYAVLIDKIDVSEDVREDMEQLVGSMQKRIDDFVKQFPKGTKMKESEAANTIERIQREKEDIEAQLEERIEKIFNNTFKRTYDNIMDIYRERLASLGYKAEATNFKFNPLDFVGQEFADIEKIVKSSTKTEDVGFDKTIYKEVDDYSRPLTNWFWKPSTWGTKRYAKKTVTDTIHVAVFEDFVDMKKVVDDYFVPVQIDLTNIERDVPEELMEQAEQLKLTLREEIGKVEKVLSQKLQDLKKKMNHADETAEKIKEREKQLEFMRDIKTRINKLINY